MARKKKLSDLLGSATPARTTGLPQPRRVGPPNQTFQRNMNDGAATGVPRVPGRRAPTRRGVAR